MGARRGVEGRLRRDALACFEAALAAVEPRRLVREALAGRPAAAGPVRLIAFGKAAAAMTAGALDALGEAVTGGVVIAPDPPAPPLPRRLRFFRGGHPTPNAAGVEGARAALELARAAGEGAELLCLISGGGSALATLPPEGVELADLAKTTSLLLEAGAPIGELNCVRKHLDCLKGGRLAAAAAPARVTALVLSDVVGDPLDVIASGPVTPDRTTFRDAVETLERRGLWERLPPRVRGHLGAGLEGEEPESPKQGDPCFARVSARIVGNNRLAAEAALAEAERRGYHAKLLTTLLTGEAREVGRVLAALGKEVRRSGEPVSPPGCLLAAGETTVTVTGPGRGGRNQEVALGAALELPGEDGILVASIATDGVDGPTDAAGGFGTGTTLKRAAAAGLDPVAALAANDAYPLLEALGDLVVVGPTGTNVMDLQLVLVAERRRQRRP
ncbi:MAG: DUF4147 domain-containing protein [Thermoanaerobaculia bacterium]|nr:DUF4147 domain-containing protein [Thermoanaerobaculia bacterium]